MIDRIRLLFLKDRESYSLLYGILGFLPGNLQPYKMALTHSSLAGSYKKKLHCNERLEFLGDAVLSSITADYLYKRFRKEREGFLSKSRSNLVCRENLNAVALEMGLDKLVHIHDIPQQHNNYVYGNALEALVGAIYIDKGYEHCRRFVLEKVFIGMPDVEAVAKSDNNHKSRLIEWAQKERRTVDFTLVSEEMRSDGSYFISEAVVDGEVYGRGEGFSKRESQQHAACEALKRIKEDVKNKKNQSVEVA